MSITIERCINGFIIKDNELNETEVIECADFLSEKNQAEAMVTLFYILKDRLGINDTRYSEFKSYAIVAPGDKNEKFTEAHSDIIYNY